VGFVENFSVVNHLPSISDSDRMDLIAYGIWFVIKLQGDNPFIESDHCLDGYGGGVFAHNNESSYSLSVRPIVRAKKSTSGPKGNSFILHSFVL
jgi:hypothetical protein